MTTSKCGSPNQMGATSHTRFATLKSKPCEDGFMMPGEFEPHDGCIVIWPERPGSWVYGAKNARVAFRNVIAAIAEHEAVYVAASPTCVDSALAMLFDDCTMEGSVADSWRFDSWAANSGHTDEFSKNETDNRNANWQKSVEVFLAQSDDAWARDVAPTFVVRRNGDAPGIRAVNWSFNAWGGNVDGAYAHWEKDDAFAREFCERYGYEMYDASPFVLEGGSIHSDGEGTLLVTETCLLSAGRNPQLSKDEIENELKTYLGAGKILWLPYGMYGDETNGHVDNICAFLRPGEVVLAWSDNENDPQYALSLADLAYLENETDSKGRKLTVHKLPIPDVPVCINEHDAAGYTFEAGEEERHVGERLAASYVNFYFAGNTIVMPTFGGENEQSDARAIALMQQWCPHHTIVPLPSRDILTGGGNIHCITQQIPASA